MFCADMWRPWFEKHGGKKLAKLARVMDDQEAFAALACEFDHRAEFVRSVVEGPGHTGDGAVVQVIAHRPA